MIAKTRADFYKKLIAHSIRIPDTTAAVLHEQLEGLRLQIVFKLKYKRNLLNLYSLGETFAIMHSVHTGSKLTISLVICLTVALVVIIEDWFELVELERSIDKLMEPDIGKYNPAPIGPFWF